MRGRIVLETRDNEPQTQMLKESNLTLEAAINIWKTAEIVRAQRWVLNKESVNKVYKKQRHPERQPPTGDQEIAGDCGCVHLMKREKCPALGNTFKCCKGLNHVAKKCFMHGSAKKGAGLNQLAGTDRYPLMKKSGCIPYTEKVAPKRSYVQWLWLNRKWLFKLTLALQSIYCCRNRLMPSSLRKDSKCGMIQSYPH